MNSPIPLQAQGAAANRHAGLSAAAADLLSRAELHLAAGDLASANKSLVGAELLAPRHPEVQRVRGALLNRAQQPGAARAVLEPLAERHPDDPVLLNDLAEARLACGDPDGALAAWRHACERDRDFAAGWFNYGKALMDLAWTQESLPVLERAVALDPSSAHARTLYADVLVLLGQLERAREEYLEVLRRAPGTGPAWWGLANIKTVRLSEEEIRRLETLHRNPNVLENNRLAMGCVLAKAYEDHGRYREAFQMLTATNARISQRRPWDPDHFSRMVDLALETFDRPHRHADDPRLGEEVIFIVSLPRSGSTLTEQILAAHPEVEGASELGDVSKTLEEESLRRGIDFPHWIAEASAEDWARLGRNYLARTARWRRSRPRSTDKMPNNWLFVPAIRAMLPGARIVNCRRDPVETCWSCFKQMFSVSNEFSYDLGYLARFWRDYDRAMRHWKGQFPDRVRDQVYEELVANPEPEIRALLAFCGLPFDPSCLQFHRVERSVRTASAAQVREPIRRNTARTAAYGELLDPLREALFRPPAEA